MFIGHAATAFAARPLAPRVPMALLFAAPFALDLLWPVFLLLGWERVRIDPGNTAVTPLDFAWYPWSHSLLMALVWSALLGAAWGAVARDRRGAWVVGSLVLSHWVLDFVTHRPDLPLAPGPGPRVGLGLWSSKAATVVVEGALFAIGLGLYLRATRARGWAGHLSLWSLAAFLVLVYAANLAGPPPPDPRALAVVGLAMFLFIPWAAWIGHTRVPAGVRDIDPAGPGVDEILARLAEQGVRLERADVEAMRPLLASLLARLARLASSLPDDAPPAPGGGSRFPS